MIMQKGDMQYTQEQIENAIRDLSREEVVEFFHERVKNNACPSCYTTSWGFTGSPDHLISLLAMPKDGMLTFPPATVSMFSVACNNCGYVRSHALGIVAAWKLNRDARKS